MGFDQMIEFDPPQHTVLRKLVSRVFTIRTVAKMEDEIRAIFTRYLDRVVAAGSAELVADLTSPYPMDVISAVLGVPAADRDNLRFNSDKIMIREDGVMSVPPEAAEGMFGLVEYFMEDFPKRKAGEGSGLINDLMGYEVDGRALTDEELMGFCVLFVIAGHETTTKMVANVVSVLLVIGAANHDEREYGPTAEDFDIFRRPERHLAFGYGAHFCLGAALARMEGKIAVEEIFRRIPDYEVDHDAKVRFHSSNVTGWRSLPITFPARDGVAV